MAIWALVATTGAVVSIGLAREWLAHASGVHSAQFHLTIFRFDAELTIPAWYSGILMLIAAMLLLLCAAIARAVRPREFV